MAPTQLKITKSSAGASFFAPRNRRNIAARNYANIERNEINPQNPPRPAAAAATPSSSESLQGDTIKVQFPPGHAEYDSDEDTTDTPPPDLSITTMTEAEKMEAIKKWLTNKEKHTKKKRDKSSHVYWYMAREALEGRFYAEFEGGPKILQEYRWSCLLCKADPTKRLKLFDVLESHRRGVTTGMGNHLKTHQITADSHLL